MKDKSWVIDVKENMNGELYIELPEELMAEANLRIGDVLTWKPGDGQSFTLNKQETQWVLVETVQTFRHRYLVQTPVGKGEWALDTVTMNEAKEFSQKALDETIVSHRVIDKDSALALCREDNDYVGSWSDEQVADTFFTPIIDLEDYTSVVDAVFDDADNWNGKDF